MSPVPIPTDTNLFALPTDLRPAEDDGAARHLLGSAIPSVTLRSTYGRLVDVAVAAEHLSVFFFYPATVAPGIPIPGEWSEIPGARGCTIENRGFRDAAEEFRALRCDLYGVSGQGQGPFEGLAEQVEFAERMHLPYELLNDSRFELVGALRLPTFVAALTTPNVRFEGKEYAFPLQGRTLVKRLTFVAVRRRVEKVFYPVFPPDRHANTVLAYLRTRSPT